MAATCLATLSLIGNEAQTGERLMRVALPVVASIVVYALAARLLGIQEVGVLIRGDRNSPTSQD
jgi:hypothetical protein